MNNSPVFKHDEIRKSRKETYQPNRFGIVFHKWDDQFEILELFPTGLKKPAIKRLSEVILPWCYKTFITNSGISEVRQVSSHKLEEIFGQKEMGEKLAKLLLYVEDQTWSFEEGSSHCKKYMLNKRVFKLLMDLSGLTEEFLIHQEANELKLEFNDEIQTGKLNYTKKSFRRYHAIVDCRSRTRDYIVANAGYNFECDVSSCAPVVIVGLAKKLGIEWDYRFLDHYLKNPNKVREQIAKKCGGGIDAKLIKKVINASIHGAEINKHGKIFEYCAGNMSKIFRLLTNKKLKKLIGELKFLIGKLDQLDQVVVPDDFEKELTTGRSVFLLYTRVEEQLQFVWEEFIHGLNGRVIHVHDGFYTDVKFNVEELESQISSQVGIDVKIEVEELSKKARSVLDQYTITD